MPTAGATGNGCDEMADHMTPEQAAESLLDTFKRAVAQELELLDVSCSYR